MNFDSFIPALVKPGGGGDGSSSDHRQLTNRDAEDQHPIQAITGLAGELDKTMTKGDALTVSEILKIMEVM